VADAWTAVHIANRSPTVFLHDGKMVEILESRHGEPRIVPIERIRFREHLSRAAAWIKATRRGLVYVSPPKDVLRAMFAAPDPKLPILGFVIIDLD